MDNKNLENEDLQEEKNENVNIESLIERIKKFPVKISLGWLVAAILSSSIFYNLVINKFNTILEQGNTVKELSEKIVTLEQNVGEQRKKHDTLVNYIEESQYIKTNIDFAIIKNITNCDSIKTVHNLLEKAIKAKKCN